MCLFFLQVKKLLQFGSGVGGTGDGMADGSRVGVDLVVVAALVGLVAEEVDGGVGDSAGLFGFGFEVLEAVGFVPAGGEDIEGDLAADGVAGIFMLVKQELGFEV